MADWRQIQARIRKAKNSPEAVSKLSELFQRTRDGMVAWELGTIEERADHKQEAGNWYILAAQRFRRADWKKKAEDALTRLGLPIPPPEAPARTAQAESADALAEPTERDSEETAHASVESTNSEPAASVSGSAPSTEAGRRKRRRGRRGGRGRRREGAKRPGSPTDGHPLSAQASRSEAPSSEVEPTTPGRVRSIGAEAPQPQLPSERVAHGRSDPALASRMAHLESLLRRLLGSPLHRLDASEEAPAGPGVFLLSDSDQTTSYYVEACQTLRVGISNLIRGGRSGKGARSIGPGASEGSLKSRLAEHLEINEAKVADYLRDHCVIRWIQLDDDAPVLAHFAVAVLRTPLNLS
jgi:hypothetical protein